MKLATDSLRQILPRNPGPNLIKLLGFIYTLAKRKGKAENPY
jgi:hypothetical protein